MEKGTLLHHLPRVRALLLLFLLAAAIASHHSAQGAPAVVYTAELRQPTADGAGPVSQSDCNGSIAECSAIEEFQMHSEVHRRLLQQAGLSLTYPVLDAQKTVCMVLPGQSYGGNCPAPSGNSPGRGCQPYDKCRIQPSS